MYLIRTDNVKVATSAQNILLHIVLMLKAWLISFIDMLILSEETKNRENHGPQSRITLPQ